MDDPEIAGHVLARVSEIVETLPDQPDERWARLVADIEDLGPLDT